MAEVTATVAAQSSGRMRTFVPPPLLTFGLGLAGILGALSLLRGVFDPDYFWHLATGRLIVESGGIPTTDPFSFTWSGERWIPDQWLSDVAIYGLVHVAGERIGLLVFGALAALAVVLVAAGLRQRDVGYRSLMAAALLAAATIVPQSTMRPQVLSLPLLAFVVFVLLTARPDRARLLWSLPFVFLIWANLHGFYVVGLGIGFVYLVATTLGHTPMSPRRARVLGVGLASLAASAITPSGPAGILYSLSFADPNDWGAQNIAEWQSPDFHDPQFLPFLLLIVGLVLFASRGPGWLRIVAFVGLAMGLLAIRSVAVAALIAMPTLAFGIDAWLRFHEPARHPKSRGDPARRWMELVAALVVAVFAAGFALSRTAGLPQPSPDRYPVAGVRYLTEHHRDARVLASYGWGGYVLHQLHPLGGRVFVDGRMHKYAPDVVADYARIMDVDPGWERLVNRYGVDAMLLPATATLTRGPAQEAGWCEALRDELQVLLLRDCG